jgi:CubicO group peptidase (beta-lactamase class C family)
MMWRAGLLALLILTWHASPAKAQDVDIEAALAKWQSDPKGDLKGVIVLRDGHVVAEHYYNGADREALHDIRSAGKSVTSLLLGIAIDRRNVRSVADSVERYWPAAAHTAIGNVRLSDVLTMRSGLAAFDAGPESPGQEDRMDEASDPAAFILSLPRANPPGTIYRYNSVTATIAGIVTARATGQTLEQFAARNLFAPLGIARWRWEADRSGYTKGQGNLSLTLRDFAAIGEMVRAGGTYRGKRVVSSGWIRQSLLGRVQIGDVDRYADGYGYFWYRKVEVIGGSKVDISFASGNGGNKIYIVPSRNMVVAIMSSAYGRGYGQKRSEDILRDILSLEIAKRAVRRLQMP